MFLIELKITHRKKNIYVTLDLDFAFNKHFGLIKKIFNTFYLTVMDAVICFHPYIFFLILSEIFK